MPILTFDYLYMSLISWQVLGTLISMMVARGISQVWQGNKSTQKSRHTTKTKANTNGLKLILLMACIFWMGKSYPTNPVEVDAVASTLAGAIS